MSNFTDRDMGFRKFMTHMRLNSGETAGLVGYLRSSGTYKPKAGQKAPTEPVTMAQIAAINEFGAVSHRGNVSWDIPERSFIRSAFDENSKFLKRLAEKLTAKVIDGSMTKTKAVGIMCQQGLDWIVAKIDSDVAPPNAPSTVAAKESSHTLIDSGQLKGAADWEIIKDK